MKWRDSKQTPPKYCEDRLLSKYLRHESLEPAPPKLLPFSQWRENKPLSWWRRASIPVFTCLLSMIFERKIPTRGEALSLFVLTAGVMIAMWRNNAGGASWAIMLCLAGTVSNAGMMSLSGKVLSEKVDVLQLTFYTAPVSFLAILPAFVLREVSSNFSSVPRRRSRQTLILAQASSFQFMGISGMCTLVAQ